jgi:hypothetical protein
MIYTIILKIHFLSTLIKLIICRGLKRTNFMMIRQKDRGKNSEKKTLRKAFIIEVFFYLMIVLFFVLSFYFLL